jgi:hypothetical protein
MSKAREGKTMSEENRLKFIERNKGNKYALGRKMTADNFEKLMTVHIGSKRTDEAKQRMSESHKGIPWDDRKWLSNHERNHISKGKVNPNCKFCSSKI